MTNQPESHPIKTSRTFRFAPKYLTLEGIANFCRVIAIIFAILGSIVAFVGLINLFRDRGFVPGLGTMIAGAIFGVSGYLSYMIISESIKVVIDIEMNTRQSATYLKHLIDRQ